VFRVCKLYGIIPKRMDATKHDKIVPISALCAEFARSIKKEWFLVGSDEE
jgi:hypothetical protein